MGTTARQDGFHTFRYNRTSRVKEAGTRAKYRGWTRLLLATLLLCINIHWCSASYELPNGKICGTCPTLSDAVNEEPQQVGTASHGDCHDCCELTVCHDSEDLPDAISNGKSYFPCIAPELTVTVNSPAPAQWDRLISRVRERPCRRQLSHFSPRAPPTFHKV